MAVSLRPLSITEVSPVTAQEWDAIYRECDYATYFHSRRWAECWRGLRTKPQVPATRIVRFSDGARAVVPMTRKVRARGLLDMLTSTTDGNIGGWISCDDLGPEHAELLTNHLLNDLEHSLSWRPNPFEPHAQLVLRHVRARATPVWASQSRSEKVARCVMNWGNPIVIDDHTHALDLSGGFDALFKPQASVCRLAKTAKRAGVEVDVTERVEDWRAYFDVYQSSLERWGRDPNDSFAWELFERIFSTPPSERKLWVARCEGKIVCGALCFYAKRHAMYWHGSALKDYFKLRPVNYLMLEIIRDACEQGHAWWDFGPSGFLSGVVRFKESFGARALAAPMVCVDDHMRRATRTVMFGTRGY
jgi:hypothetical protein